jgi:O-6-methylguanine DNA methyltransferase
MRYLMSAVLKYDIQETPYGWIGALRSKHGMRSTSMPEPSPERVIENLGKDVRKSELEPGLFSALFGKIEGFLAGRPIDFDEVIDPGMGTPFAQLVWKATREIPRGETRSYSWVAQRAGYPRAARAVGRTMATNPFPPIVPCHRVIGADGSLCGYGAGGLAVKQRLLDLESPE